MADETFRIVITTIATIICSIIGGAITILVAYKKNESEAMKNLLNSCSERLSLIQAVKNMRQEYGKASSELYQIEHSMFEPIQSGDNKALSELRSQIIDVFTEKVIPNYKYYAEAFFAVYFKSKPDLDFFFKSDMLEFFNLTINTICFANNKTIFPEQSVMMGISEYDAEDLFRIAKRHVGFFDWGKKRQLKKLRKLFKPLINELLPIPPSSLPFQSESDIFIKAISDKLRTLSLTELKKVTSLVSEIKQHNAP
jgi:hypothetical protein